MSGYWLKCRIEFIRFDDIHKISFRRSQSSGQYYVCATSIKHLKADRHKGTFDNVTTVTSVTREIDYQITSDDLTKTQANEVIQKIMMADPKYLIKVGESGQNLEQKLDLLIEMIKYQPGGPFFQEKLAELEDKMKPENN